MPGLKLNHVSKRGNWHLDSSSTYLCRPSAWKLHSGNMDSSTDKGMDGMAIKSYPCMASIMTISLNMVVNKSLHFRTLIYKVNWNGAFIKNHVCNQHSNLGYFIQELIFGIDLGSELYGGSIENSSKWIQYAGFVMICSAMPNVKHLWKIYR